jgi:hypothetical protein
MSRAFKNRQIKRSNSSSVIDQVSITATVPVAMAGGRDGSCDCDESTPLLLLETTNSKDRYSLASTREAKNTFARKPLFLATDELQQIVLNGENLTISHKINGGGDEINDNDIEIGLQPAPLSDTTFKITSTIPLVFLNLKKFDKIKKTSNENGKGNDKDKDNDKGKVKGIDNGTKVKPGESEARITTAEEQSPSTPTTPTCWSCIAQNAYSVILTIVTFSAQVYSLTMDGCGPGFLATLSHIVSPVTAFIAAFLGLKSLHAEHAFTQKSIADLRGETHQDIADLRGEMHQGIDNLRGEMHQGLADLQAQIDDLRKGKTIRVYRNGGGDGHDYKEVLTFTDDLEHIDIDAPGGGEALLSITLEKAKQDAAFLNPFDFEEYPELCQMIDDGKMQVYVSHMGRPITINQFMALPLKQILEFHQSGVVQVEITVKKPRGY